MITANEANRNCTRATERGQEAVSLSDIRRIGKTTFIEQDLVPALIDHGALVLYVDLWTDRTRPPMALMQ